MKSLIVIISLVIISSCGKDKEIKSESYTYTLELNGCNTGTHTFASQNELCNALLDDTLNGNCAHSLRENRYKNDKCESLTGKQF